MTGNTHVVVVGGGYAGVMAANRLTQRDDVTVTLINPREELVHRVRLHQLVGGSDDALVAYRDVLAERIRLVDDERVLAARDSAAPSDLPLRMSCLNATPLGARAADTVLSRLAGRQPDLLHQGLYAQCISLGRKAGIYQFATRSDVAVGVHIGAGLGARIKESVCTGILGHLVKEAKRPGTFRLHRVPGGVAKRRALLRAQQDDEAALAERAV